MWILLKPLNFKTDFFGAEITLCIFKKNKNINKFKIGVVQLGCSGIKTALIIVLFQ